MAYDPKLSWDGVAAAMEGPGIGPVLNGGSIRRSILVEWE